MKPLPTLSVNFMSEESVETATAYRGLVCTAVMDVGPEVLFNLSEVEENITHMLAIQALTMISMGSGSEGMHGPIPVPHSPELQALVYTFFAPAPDSKDERVRRSGRHYAMFLLFSKSLGVKEEDVSKISFEFMEELLKAIMKVNNFGEADRKKLTSAKDLFARRNELMGSKK